MSQKTPATGQTGSGQARLTLRGSNRREPRDWNGAPLSGSHLGPHIRPPCRCNKAVCREAVCSSFTLFAPPAYRAHQHRRAADEYEYSLTRGEVPVVGLKARRSLPPAWQGSAIADWSTMVQANACVAVGLGDDWRWPFLGGPGTGVAAERLKRLFASHRLQRGRRCLLWCGRPQDAEQLRSEANGPLEGKACRYERAGHEISLTCGHCPAHALLSM